MQSVVLGTDVATDQPVSLSQEARTRGLYLLGKNGTGKSTLILNMILQDIEQGQGVCLLDPHRDLTDDILMRVPDERKREVYVLDILDAAYPFGLNLYECEDPTDPVKVAGVANRAVQVFKKVWGGRVVGAAPRGPAAQHRLHPDREPGLYHRPCPPHASG